MTDREILDLKLHFLLESLSDETLQRHADLAGALIFPSTGQKSTAQQLRRWPPAELKEQLARVFADRLEALSVAIQAGKTVVRERINPEDLRRRSVPTLNFPDPED